MEKEIKNIIDEALSDKEVTDHKGIIIERLSSLGIHAFRGWESYKDFLEYGLDENEKGRTRKVYESNQLGLLTFTFIKKGEIK